MVLIRRMRGGWALAAARETNGASAEANEPCAEESVPSGEANVPSVEERVPLCAVNAPSRTVNVPSRKANVVSGGANVVSGEANVASGEANVASGEANVACAAAQGCRLDESAVAWQRSGPGMSLGSRTRWTWSRCNVDWRSQIEPASAELRRLRATGLGVHEALDRMRGCGFTLPAVQQALVAVERMEYRDLPPLFDERGDWDEF